MFIEIKKNTFKLISYISTTTKKAKNRWIACELTISYIRLKGRANQLNAPTEKLSKIQTRTHTHTRIHIHTSTVTQNQLTTTSHIYLGLALLVSSIFVWYFSVATYTHKPTHTAVNASDFAEATAWTESEFTNKNQLFGSTNKQIV